MKSYKWVHHLPQVSELQLDPRKQKQNEPTSCFVVQASQKLLQSTGTHS